MRKYVVIFTVWLMLLPGIVIGQVKIGPNSGTINEASILELESNNKALVLTRITNVTAVLNPINGMLVYDISSNCVKAFENGKWTTCLSNGSHIEPSTNGSAKVTGYNCGFSATGNLFTATNPIGVTQTITAFVTQIGSYAISAIANGVVFSGSGVFTTLGVNNVVLTASGVPVQVGTNSFSINTIPSCSFIRATLSITSGGTAVVNTYTCNTASSGTLIVNTPVSGVTQTITANFTAIGSYSISTPVLNGVYFSGSGIVNATGNQSIVLTAYGTPATAGNFTYNLNTSPNCSFTRSCQSSLPANLTLGAVSPYFIASVYDVDYLPYSVPSSAASLAVNQAANGVNESVAINFQGSLTTTGVIVPIPYTVVNSTVSLPAFSQTITVPSSYTEDNVSRDIVFSYPAATLTVGSGTINATLKSIGGILNPKKLDIQTGIGYDHLGWLLARFTYIINNSGSTSNFDLRLIAGIPDRNFGDGTHNMLYLPITSATGKIWLNNNLGANYSNTSKSVFNLVQQATRLTDYNAYGSLIQWGRKTDGHELINWTTSTSGSIVNGTTTIRADNPANSKFILNTVSPYDWRLTQNDNLWNGESSVNNPCPYGFRLPTLTEINAEYNAYSITDPATGFNSLFKFTTPGNVIATTGNFNQVGAYGFYWTSTPSGAKVNVKVMLTGGAGTYVLERGAGFCVRCIKD